MFASLFTLDDATVVVRVEANKLLFSTLELIVKPRSPAADWLEESAAVSAFDGKRVLLELARRLLQSGRGFQGAADLLGVRFPANTDPQDGIADFNAALTAERRKNTLDDEEVKGQSIRSRSTPNTTHPWVSRLLVHDQRAAVDLLVIQQWARECHATHVERGTAQAGFRATSTGMTHGDSEAVKDLAEIILQLGKQLEQLEDKVDSYGFSARGRRSRSTPGGSRSIGSLPSR
ncbi:hypothetical protein CYMTET_56550 [Cymbomonas tetramitiformis]|uniref:Uncharacterized protein n=1 Tax=Cymbomonas tetramitiformis TaxID=36881 RepID=A0AAE0BBX4_9CHLO|nr:hypothetical protein CYMTET_56550 [Cymbomonas tetramitiformis]